MLLISITCLTAGYSQIVGGDDKPVEEKKVKVPKEKMNRDSLSGTTYYATGLFNHGARTFEDQSVYGSYADWYDQKADYAGGMTIGVFLPVGKNLALDIGFTYFGHKEKYNYDDPNSDSTYFFSNTYMQIGVPVKLRYTYGDRLQVFGFAGLTPVNTLNIRFSEKYTRANGNVVSPELTLDKQKLAIFNLMFSSGVGVTYNFDWVGITFFPEFRQHLFQTYEPTKPIRHRMYGLGLNLGLTLRL